MSKYIKGFVMGACITYSVIITGGVYFLIKESEKNNYLNSPLKHYRNQTKKRNIRV